MNQNKRPTQIVFKAVKCQSVLKSFVLLPFFRNTNASRQEQLLIFKPVDYETGEDRRNKITGPFDQAKLAPPKLLTDMQPQAKQNCLGVQSNYVKKPFLVTAEVSPLGS